MTDDRNLNAADGSRGLHRNDLRLDVMRDRTMDAMTDVSRGHRMNDLRLDETNLDVMMGANRGHHMNGLH